MADEWFTVLIPEHQFTHLLRVALYRNRENDAGSLGPNYAVIDDPNTAEAWVESNSFSAELIPTEGLQEWLDEHVVGKWAIDGKLAGRRAKIGFTDHTDMMAFRLRWT